MSNYSDQSLINKLIYRSWHRGCKETDILLGDFAKGMIEQLSTQELAVYEVFIEEDDDLIYKWLLSDECNVEKYIPIIEKIKEFNELKQYV